ncbi:hypothetical protein [Bradyrhizobium embrapense]
MRVVDHEAVCDRRKGQVGRGVVGIVDAAVAAEQIGLLHEAALILHRTAGDVEGRAPLRHHLRRRQRDAAADRGPFADVVAGVVEIATNLEQATGGVVAIRRIATGGGRHEGQITRVDPDVLVDEHTAVAVLRAVAQLVALDVDVDRVCRHRQYGADSAGDVDHRSVLGEHALAGRRRHLPALGHGQRAVLEVDGAAGDDLDARLIGTIRQCREIVELAAGQSIGSGRRHESIAL